MSKRGWRASFHLPRYVSAIGGPADDVAGCAGQQRLAPGMATLAVGCKAPIGVDRQMLVGIGEFYDPQIAPMHQLVRQLARHQRDAISLIYHGAQYQEVRQRAYTP